MVVSKTHELHIFLKIVPGTACYIKSNCQPISQIPCMCTHDWPIKLIRLNTAIFPVGFVQAVWCGLTKNNVTEF